MTRTLLLILAAAAACTEPARPGAPDRLELLTALPDTVAVGDTLGTPPRIRAIDAKGRPVPGIRIDAEVEPGMGKRLSATGRVTTDADGIATFPGLRFGARLSGGGPTEIRFRATDYESEVLPLVRRTFLRCNAGQLAAGAVIARTLTDADCVSQIGVPSGKLYHQYQWATRDTASMRLTIESSPAVSLSYVDESEPIQRWVLPTGIRPDTAHQRAVPYYIIKLRPSTHLEVGTDYYDGALVPYTLRVEEGYPHSGCELGVIPHPTGTTKIEGVIGQTDCLAEEVRYDDYIFDVPKPSAVEVTATTYSAYPIAISLSNPNTNRIIDSNFGNYSATTRVQTTIPTQLVLRVSGQQHNPLIGGYSLSITVKP